MKVTILSIIFALGLLLPLFWILGTVTSIVYFYLHRERESAALDRQVVAFNPQLGLTMADGGDAIDNKKKELPRSPGDDGGKPIRNERRN